MNGPKRFNLGPGPLTLEGFNPGSYSFPDHHNLGMSPLRGQDAFLEQGRSRSPSPWMSSPGLVLPGDGQQGPPGYQVNLLHQPFPPLGGDSVAPVFGPPQMAGAAGMGLPVGKFPTAPTSPPAGCTNPTMPAKPLASPLMHNRMPVASPLMHNRLPVARQADMQ